jgi:quinol monooxygenase YgiN
MTTPSDPTAAPQPTPATEPGLVPQPVTVGYGFSSTMTALPGRGDELVELLLSGLEPGNPGSTEYCVVYLVSRSASEPDVAHIVEGWTSIEDHHRIFAGEAAQTIVARFEGLLTGEPTYTDLTPVSGKAAF